MPENAAAGAGHQHLAPRSVLSLCAYSLSCALLHGLLQQHYFSQCRASWLALFSLDPGPYCALVRKGLLALQWSPVLASGFWLHPAAGVLLRH